MYNLSALAMATYDEKLHAAARDHLRHRAYAPRRAENQSALARRVADLRILRIRHVLRGRRAAQAF
jgi:hypothetical protein